MIILCLGNEFVKNDSFAIKVSDELSKSSKDIEIIKIKDSFQLIEALRRDRDLIILDVVEGINDIKILKIEDLRFDSIVTAHDFDAGFVLKLFGEGKRIKIIGIPMDGDIETIKNKIIEILSKNLF